MKLYDGKMFISIGAIFGLVVLTAIVKDIPYALNLFVLSLVAFIQNMAFTLVSRSRNSGDPEYHRYCAWGSNGIWFICYVTLWRSIWDDIMSGNVLPILLVGVVYGLATAEGSVLMMRIALNKEKGNKRVGARHDSK